MTQADHAFAEARAAFRGGDEPRAEALLRKALGRDPDHTPSLSLLALVVGRAGRNAEAVSLLERAHAHLLGDEAAAAEQLLAAACARDGIALQERGELEASAAQFERALALRPGFVEARYNLATARKEQGRTDEAVALLRQVVAEAPDLAEARFALCMAHLPPLCRDEAEVEQRRADYAAELEALVAHAGRVGPAALASGVGAAQPFQLAYLGGADHDLQRSYGELACRAMAAAFPLAPLAARSTAGERIRVGVVCGFFRDHSVWRLPTRGWAAGLDRSRFELIGYHTSRLCDATTDAARALFDRFVQAPLPSGDWRAQIAADRPHALIYPEIGMNPVVAQLAAMRLAPVQYASWGHPTTSGHPTIDYFLTSAAMEPPDGDAQYTERLVRLPGLSTSVVLEPLATPVPSRASLGLPADAPVFWCAQSLGKYLPRYDRLFAAIAAKTRGCRFVFIEHPGSPALTQRFRARLAAVFAERDLEADAHCVFLPRLAPQAFRAAIGCADVVLDSVGWSGCNTLIDSLAHGLPIVTLPGETMRARHGLGLLAQLGLERFACADQQDYVDFAAALASDRGARREIGAATRAALPRLNDPAPVAALERHILEACSAAARPEP